jgi:small subunit ribosomal protein S10
MQKLRVKLTSSDVHVLDAAAELLALTVRATHARTHGPIPLATQPASPQTETGLALHSRLVDLIDPSPRTLDALIHQSLPAGVDIELS